MTCLFQGHRYLKPRDISDFKLHPEGTLKICSPQNAKEATTKPKRNGGLPNNGKLFFAIWVIADLYPFLKGLLGRQNSTHTIVIVWSILLASIFSLLWVRIDPFTSASTKSAANGQCGINC